MEDVINKMAYAEVYEMLELLGDKYKKKIPSNYYKFIVDQRPEKYDVEKVRKLVANDELSEEGLKLFTTINIEYFVEDELAKKAYKEIISSNKRKKQNIDIPKVDIENIKEDVFEDRKNNDEKKQELIQNQEIVKYEKNNIFNRIINKIKNWLKKK